MNFPQLPEPWVGRLIGNLQRYRLDKRLGEGGMGEVFVAMDTRLGQPVALKLLKEKLAASEDVRKRFEREVALCAALRSDHIVQVSDHGVTDEGYPFFVMEYLCGQTLGKLLKREQRLSAERTVNIVTQVCAGLHLAHKGINLWHDGAASSEYVKVVHRDLKPENIFLVPTVLGELVKILDFGIAKLCSDQVEQTNATNVFLGTYHYAAPEQLEVEKDLDERADIYSLGIIIYEMLSGTDPFGLSFITNKISNLAWAVAHASKPPLPLREQLGCEQLSPELEAVVMRCLQKTPRERFGSVDELSKALQAAASGLREFRDVTYAANAPYSAIISRSMRTYGEQPTMRSPISTSSYSQFSTLTSKEISETAHSAVQSIATLSAAVVEKPEVLSSDSPSQPKSVWLMVRAGLIMTLAVTLGAYYSSRSSNPSVVQEVEPLAETEPIIDKQEISLANSLSKHLNSVWSVAISPDGQTLGSASLDKTIKLWNLGDGELLRTFSGHSDAVRTVAIDSSGQILASGSVDRTVKIWNLQTGELLRTLSGHSDPVWSVAISPDKQTLVSGSYDSTIKIWNVQNGELLHTLSNHSDSVWSVAISPDGQTLVSGSKDKTIKIWNLQTGKLLRTLKGHSDAVRTVAISPDGQRIVSGSWDKTIKIWNLQTGKLLRTLSGHSDRVISVAINPSGQTLVSGSLDKTVHIWDLQTGELRHTLSGHSDWVLSIAFSPDGQTIVSGSKDKTIKIWR